MPDDATTAIRARLRNDTPARYRWQRHVALVAAFTAAGLAVPLAATWPLRGGDGVALAVLLVAIVLGEYASHRWSMHRPRFPRAVHHRHVVEHHAFFTHDRMAMDDLTDLRWVLFPPWALPLLVVAVLPFFAGLWALVLPRTAWLLLLAVIAYYGVYEITHALAHLRVHDDPLGRAVAALTRHHRVHHDPQLMRRWNFNFVVPLGDWLWGTTWRPPHPRPAVTPDAVDPTGR
jgi:sterol desaturase/sphingolipid hydroxylase (fatty acid hydroxylase superfamily)